MLQRRLFLTLGALAITACAAPAPEAEAPAADPAADQAAIAAVRDGYAAAFKAGDAAGVARLFTADANDMEPGMPTMVGAGAVEAGLTAMMAEMTVEDMVITSEKTEISGDLAYDRGTYRGTMRPKAGGDPMVDEGRYLVVLARQADGGWKIAEAMANMATGAEMPAGAPPAP